MINDIGEFWTPRPRIRPLMTLGGIVAALAVWIMAWRVRR